MSNHDNEEIYKNVLLIVIYILSLLPINLRKFVKQLVKLAIKTSIDN